MWERKGRGVAMEARPEPSRSMVTAIWVSWVFRVTRADRVSFSDIGAWYTASSRRAAFVVGRARPPPMVCPMREARDGPPPGPDAPRRLQRGRDRPARSERHPARLCGRARARARRRRLPPALRRGQAEHVARGLP